MMPFQPDQTRRAGSTEVTENQHRYQLTRRGSDGLLEESAVVYGRQRLDGNPRLRIGPRRAQHGVQSVPPTLHHELREVEQAPLSGGCEGEDDTWQSEDVDRPLECTKRKRQRVQL